jgi:DNA-binding GntR family transcriptional regulator
MADVTSQIRSDILSGEFPPASRLIELQLTERYGVGRAAIRSAIVELSAEGLVVHEPNRGATVRNLSVEVAIEIAQARAVLEGILARQAADRATDAERTELSQIVIDMKAATAAADQERYSGLNRVLHQRVREISGHSIASELVANLRNRGAHQEFRLALVPGRSEVSLRQHEAIVDAIVAGDGPRAEQAMHAHLASVEDALRAWTPSS